MYKELHVWKESVELIKNVYKKAESLPKSEEFNLKQQLKRAVVSVALYSGRKKQEVFKRICLLPYGVSCIFG